MSAVSSGSVSPRSTRYSYDEVSISGNFNKPVPPPTTPTSTRVEDIFSSVSFPSPLQSIR